jgi:hypothetical protein
MSGVLNKLTMFVTKMVIHIVLTTSKVYKLQPVCVSQRKNLYALDKDD